MDGASLHLNEIEQLIRTQGEVQFQIAGRAITLNLQHRHERNYAASLLLKLAYPQADIDTMLFERILRPGDFVLDAGANIGYTALKCLSLGAKRVVAVEPLPELYSRLEQIADDRVLAVNKAISCKLGTQNFMVSQSHNQGSTLKKEIVKLFRPIFGNKAASLEVETITVDALTEVYGRFDVWKLDIEGSEVDALRGASETLKKYPPRAIMAELFGELPAEFAKLANFYPYKYRAMIQKSDYRLLLENYEFVETDAHHPMSPTFVFSTERLT